MDVNERKKYQKRKKRKRAENLKIRIWRNLWKMLEKIKN